MTASFFLFIAPSEFEEELGRLLLEFQDRFDLVLECVDSEKALKRAFSWLKKDPQKVFAYELHTTETL